MTKYRAPLVSVVTPFFNTEEYLGECIESVLAQTYQNWEYVLVDNKSSDRSLEIAKHYAANDQRIRVVQNDRFLTQVENYNHGLRQISPDSKYCKIVQADDWIYPDCLQAMVCAAESSDDIALVGSYTLQERLPPCGDRSYVEGPGLPYTQRVVNGRQLLRDYLQKEVSFFGSPTTVMFRAKEVRLKHEFFDPNSPVEDIQACFDVLAVSDFAFVHQILSFNRRQHGSLFWDASRYDSHALNSKILLHRYGMTLFSPSELEEVAKTTNARYYLCLAHAFLDGRDAGFWRYHAQGLASIGSRISAVEVMRRIPGALIDLMGNPKATIGRVYRGMQRSRSQRKSNRARD